jgi:hypothetical protein
MHFGAPMNWSDIGQDLIGRLEGRETKKEPLDLVHYRKA